MAKNYDEMRLNYKKTSTPEKGGSSEAWDEFDKCTGNEIRFDMNEKDTVMGQMFYEKWRKVNTETMRLRSGTVDLMTNLRMFGKYFPCKIRLKEGNTR
jgi:phenolic acid decarboxylase